MGTLVWVIVAVGLDVVVAVADGGNGAIDVSVAAATRVSGGVEGGGCVMHT